jgi:hypothetical protein
MAEKSGIIPLGFALHILTSIHTRDDDLTGFVTMSGAGPEYTRWSHAEYIEAWKSVRHNIGMQVAAIHERTETAQQRPISDETTVNETGH